MPYRLRVTQGEVRQELAKMGFKGLSDDTVAAMHKDLLKMIKSDIQKMKHQQHHADHTDTSSDLHPPAADKQHTHHKSPQTSLHSAGHTPKKTHTKEKLYSSLSASYTSEDKNESTGESGYSDVESTITSGQSDVGSFSAIDDDDDYAPLKPRRHKEAATKEPLKKTKGQVSESSVQTVAPGKRTTGKTKVKQVGKKDLPQYPSKPDPVRLYHYYKAHWDRYKMPGEDPRLKLRWAVRSKLFYAE